MARSDKYKEDNSKQKKKMKTSTKVVLSIITVLILLVGGVIGGGIYYAKTMLDKVETVEINKEELSIKPEIEEKFGEVRNIALFGIDAPDGRTGRSDAIMILTLDTVHNKMKLTSIMRDSYVDIPGRGMDKINHAYAFGGPELAIKTLNENFDLNIKEFMSVNFTSLPTIINKLGGVDVEITSEEVSHIPGISSPGTYTLTGEQALSYARIRYASGGDYKRTERQRTVINAVFNKMKSTSVTQYPALISDFLPYVTTNMDSSQILGLATDFSSLLTGGLEQDRFPRDGFSKGDYINNIYYLTFDRDIAVEQMHDWMFEDIK